MKGLTERGNGRAVANASKASAAERWAAFDAMPRDTRRALRDCTIPMCPHWLTGVAGPMAPPSLVRAFEASERALFAAAHEAAGFGPLPHIAAGATVLRSGEAPC